MFFLVWIPARVWRGGGGVRWRLMRRPETRDTRLSGTVTSCVTTGDTAVWPHELLCDQMSYCVTTCVAVWPLAPVCDEQCDHQGSHAPPRGAPGLAARTEHGAVAVEPCKYHVFIILVITTYPGLQADSVVTCSYRSCFLFRRPFLLPALRSLFSSSNSFFPEKMKLMLSSDILHI